MTITDATTLPPLREVTFDLYRDIHKGIRSELFAVTLEAGRLDPGDPFGRFALNSQVRSVVDLLVSHAEHEDGAIQPVLEGAVPDLAEQIAVDHEALEARMDGLLVLAADVVEAVAATARSSVHRLYLELGAFTSAYLAHQDVEERVVMPVLEDILGVEAVIGIHGAILAGIPPQELTSSLALMLPVMNVDDRTEMMGGMRASAPAEAFQGVWELMSSALEPAAVAAVAGRLGI